MIALGSDHGGYELKQAVIAYLEEKHIPYKDYGCFTKDACDYPDIAKSACEPVIKGECGKALLFCGTGIGISIAANKIKGIRAACCSDYYSVKYTRLHNDANVLCLGGRVVGPGLAFELVQAFLSTEFEGKHHINRIKKIAEIENRYTE